MPLNPGTRLGVYEVSGSLGAGGMGEVYRARDTRLDRDVALKVLPEAFTADPDRLARFEREAKLLASLNHPNIASIYGLEESGDSPALALELVEGPTLADRIAQGAMQIKDALPIARQIAEALEAAHEQGIIHRDLKPANIKVRDDGTVKVLDFGLAKAMAGEQPNQDLSQSPTLTATIGGTREGVILGTATYMSPEQARGKPVDKRTDIWAFGCVLFEMLTGQAAFAGETLSDTIGRVMEREPQWSALPEETPGLVERLLRRCLVKDRRERLRDIGDARLELEPVPTGDADPLGEQLRAAAASSRRSGVTSTWLATTVVAVLATVLVTRSLLRPTESDVEYVEIGIEGSLHLGASSPDLAIAPDGRSVAFLERTEPGGHMLQVRPLDQPRGSTVAAGLPFAPFFSPDGESLAFLDFQPSRPQPAILKSVSVHGGPSRQIMAMPTGTVRRGSSWASDGTIVFGTTATGGGLWRVPATGGNPVQITTPDGAGEHMYPEVLPGGRAVVFTIMPPDDITSAQLAVVSLEGGTPERLNLGGSQPRYASSGHLLYVFQGALHAVGFDVDSLNVTTEPVPVLDELLVKTTGGANYDIADDGTLFYMSGPAQDVGVGGRTLLDTDLEGRTLPLTEEQSGYSDPRFSPNGRYVAVTVFVRSGRLDVWLLDLERNNQKRVIVSTGEPTGVVWSPDGRWLAFADQPYAENKVLLIPFDGDGEPITLLDEAARQVPTSWSPGGLLAFHQQDAETGWDIWELPVSDEGVPGNPVAVLATPANERSAAFAPDGQRLAYVSDVSGRDEVYVRPYPGSGRAQLVSADGGEAPAWSSDGTRLFFRSGSQMLAVPIAPGIEPVVGEPAVLFERSDPPGAGGLLPNYDVRPDGEGFVMVDETASQQPARRLHLILNWHQVLLDQVPLD